MVNPGAVVIHLSENEVKTALKMEFPKARHNMIKCCFVKCGVTELDMDWP